MSRAPWRALAAAASAAALLGPAVWAGPGAAPGAPRADVEDGLWAALHLLNAREAGAPLWRAPGLNHPDGGVVLPADPVGAAVIAALAPLVGLGRAATALCGAQLALAGWVVHTFSVERAAAAGRGGRRVEAVGFVAALSYMTCGTLLSTLHNGSWEDLGAGAPALGAWMAWRLARCGGVAPALGCAAAIAWGALQGPYIGALTLGFAGALLSRGPAPLRARIGALALGLALAAPWAWAVQAAAAHPDGLLRIKGAAQLAALRRSVGPADLRSFFLPFDARAPDFARLGRGGESFLHCGYLGFVSVAGALLAPRLPGDRRLWAAGIGAGLLALGPVLLIDGRPWLIGGRALPLPYAALEALPGFSSLTLLWRLGLGLSLAIALRLGAQRRGLWAATGLLIAVGLEAVALNPAGRARGVVAVSPPAAIEALAAAPPGAVVVGPAGAAGPWLLHAAQHGQPVAATFNFAANDVSETFLAEVPRDVLEEGAPREGGPAESGCAAARDAARARGLRYVLIYDAPEVAPDPRTARLRALSACGARLTAPDAAGPVAWSLW